MINKKNQFGKFMADYGMAMADNSLGVVTSILTGKDISDLTGYENKTNSDFIKFMNTQSNITNGIAKTAAPSALAALGVPPAVTMAAQQVGTGLAGDVEKTNTGWLPKMKFGGAIPKSTIEVEGNELEVTPDGKVVNDFSKMAKHKDGGVVYGATTGNHIISSKNKDKFSRGDSITKSSIMLSQSRNQAQGDALMDKFANGGKITPFIKWATENGMTKSEAKKYAKGGIVKYEEGAPVKKQSMLTAEEVVGNENMFTNPNDIGYSKFNNFMDYGLSNPVLSNNGFPINQLPEEDPGVPMAYTRRTLPMGLGTKGITIGGTQPQQATPVQGTPQLPNVKTLMSTPSYTDTYNSGVGLVQNPNTSASKKVIAQGKLENNGAFDPGTASKSQGFDPNYLNAIVPYLGPAFQLGQTFTKKQYVPRANNPYATKAMNMMANRTYDINPALADVKEASRVGNYNNRQIANNTGAYLAGNTANVNARNKATSALWAQKANMDNTYRGEEAQLMANLGAQEAQYENAYQTGKVMTDANARNIRSEAGTNMSKIYQQQNAERNTVAMQNKMLKLYPELFPVLQQHPDLISKVLEMQS